MKTWLRKFSLRERLLGLSLMALLLSAALDYASGTRFSVESLYILPVAAAALGGGFWPGLVMAVLANLLRLLLALSASAHALETLYSEALLDFCVELILVYGLTYLRLFQEMREEMVQFIAHDFRTPLGNIMIGLDVLHEQPAVQEQAAALRLVEMCQTSAQRLLHLSNSMLDLARLENGQMQLQVQALDVAEAVQTVFEQLGLWAEQSHITLQFQHADAAQRVMADALLLNRILLNLVGNAIKYSRPHSTVLVQVEPVKRQVRFAITDQGPGIPPHLVARVFDRFFQVEARRFGQATGSGLGLTFCRAAVLAQKGSIDVESELGRGTTVSFTLPMSSAPEEGTA